MFAQRYMVKVRSDGSLEMPAVKFAPGSEVEVIVLAGGVDDDVYLSEATALLSQDAFARVWDSPEEDEAWEYLQQAM